MRKLLQALAKVHKYPPIAIPRDVPMPSLSLREAIDFWEGLPASGAMKQVILETVSCQVTEDATTDECRLEVFADGAFQAPAARRAMKVGHLWPLNLAYPFNSSVQVKLWDEDAPDPDDLRAGSSSMAQHGNMPRPPSRGTRRTIN